MRRSTLMDGVCVLPGTASTMSSQGLIARPTSFNHGHFLFWRYIACKTHRYPIVFGAWWNE